MANFCWCGLYGILFGSGSYGVEINAYGILGVTCERTECTSSIGFVIKTYQSMQRNRYYLDGNTSDLYSYYTDFLCFHNHHANGRVRYVVITKMILTYSTA